MHWFTFSKNKFVVWYAIICIVSHSKQNDQKMNHKLYLNIHNVNFKDVDDSFTIIHIAIRFV